MAVKVHYLVFPLALGLVDRDCMNSYTGGKA